ncbi:unnamed protein product [Calypogeia fissa]
MVRSVSWISDEEIRTLRRPVWDSGQSGLLCETGLIQHVHIEGAFLYRIRYFDGEVLEVHVTNMLTREWKRLTDRPISCDLIIECIKLVIDPSSQNYKVILISYDKAQRLSGQMYDSKSETWSSPQSIVEYDYVPSIIASAYLNGVFYLAANANPDFLLAVNLETRTSEELRLVPTDQTAIQFVGALIVCNDQLMMVELENVIVHHRPSTLRVLSIDLLTLTLLEVTRFPADLELEVVDSPRKISSRIHEKCMYFQLPRFHDDRVVEYNTSTDEWKLFSCPLRDFQWNACSCRPGLNPFMAV